MNKRDFTFTITYFKPDGKYYTDAKCVMSVRSLDNNLEQLPYLFDAVARIRGWRDCGGQGALPGLEGAGWEGPILIQCGDGVPHLLMPKRI